MDLDQMNYFQVENKQLFLIIDKYFFHLILLVLHWNKSDQI